MVAESFDYTFPSPVCVSLTRKKVDESNETVLRTWLNGPGSGIEFEILHYFFNETIPIEGNACDCLCYKSFIIPWGRLHYLLIGYIFAFFFVIATVFYVIRLHKKQTEGPRESDEANKISNTDI